MTSRKEFLFFIGGIAAALMLSMLSFSDSKVAMLRLEHLLRSEVPFGREVYQTCQSLTGTQNDKYEQLFLKYFAPSASNSAQRACRIRVTHTETQRFHLRSIWNFGMDVHTADGAPIALKSFPIDFPRPLCFLPIFLFLLAILLKVEFWGLGWTLSTYLFLMSGANFIHMTHLSVKSAAVTATHDPTFMGLLLILLWLSIYRFGRDELHRERQTHSRIERQINRVCYLLIGLWSPALFTMLGRVLYPAKESRPRFMPFLDAQFLVACLSLYLLSFDFNHPGSFLLNSFTLPRYFTFTALILVTISLTSPQTRAPSTLWQLPRFWKSIGFVIAIEVAAIYIRQLGDCPNLVRIGLALVLSELASRRKISMRSLLRHFVPSAGMVFLLSFMSTLSIESGVLDMALILWEPQAHPTGYVLFTFLAGIAIGFLTGSFSATFLSLFTLMMSSYNIPLVRGALLDGVLAGSLLSPFSLYNLIPVVQFGTRLHDLIAHRFKQLALPIGIGIVIYTVSAVNSVAILRPVTFVFLCLVAFAFQLRRSDWHIGRLRQILR